MTTLQTLNWGLHSHPSYSPGQTSSDFHVVGPLKDTCRGQQFADNKEVQEAVCMASHAHSQKPCIPIHLKACTLMGEVY
jgi:hypothetical protein